MAVELEKLRAVFSYESGAWETAAPLYLEALSDMPYDLLREAVAVCIRTAGPGDHFPKPGAIRAVVNDVLEVRKARLKRAQTPKQDEAWPKWLQDIWGPLPDGMILRNGAFARAAVAKAEQKRPLPQFAEQDRIRAAAKAKITQAATTAERKRAIDEFVSLCVQQATDNIAAYSARNKRAFDEPQQVREALGVTATERKPPRHEDPEELRKGRIELGLEEP